MHALPYLIGIAGASCSGKTTVADLLAKALGPQQTATIALDSYYYDISHMPPEAVDRHNLDEPAALEGTLLVEHLAALAAGRPIDKPIYDHKTHTRLARVERVEPRPYVIIEGLFALYWEQARAHMRTRAFIDLAHDVCLERRIERDRNQRGRAREEVTKRYTTTVGPMFDRYVLPTRAFAHTVTDGRQPPETSVEAILEHIRETKNE